MQNLGFPGGPDWTREADERPFAATPRGQELLRASAYGRARGRLNAALEQPNAEVRDKLIQSLILQLVDYALTGADIKTILDGLVWEDGVTV